jgi:hypothetical protein
MPRTLRRHCGIRHATAALAAGVVALVAPGLASAAQFNVTTTSDHAPDQTGCTAADCTLREALAAGAAASGVVDAINVPAGHYVLQMGQLTVLGDNIIGAGARTTVIDGNNASRVLTTSAPAAGGPAPTAQLLNVTVTGGNAGTGQAGGGVAVPTGVLQVLNSSIVGNTAGSGGGIAVGGSAALVMIGSTVSGNVANALRLTRGGGIANVSDAGTLAIGNSTISNNVARDPAGAAQGGGISMPFGPNLTLLNVTIAENEANEGGGLFLGPGTTRTINNTLVSLNIGGACAFGSATTLTTHNNLIQDNSCLLQGAGDVQGVADAKLLGLANNGGPSDTRALAPGSLAIDKGSACAASDQRGITRPAAACDIGAFEYVAPKLTVTTTVVNDNGGTASPSSLTVHVARSGGGDVAGSPQPGSAAGTTYTLDPGGYVVSADALTGYSITIGGNCSAAGAVTLAENEAKSCTVVADDTPKTTVENSPLPPPMIRKTANLVRPRGTVTIKLPGNKKFETLEDDEQVPVGTTVNVKKGRITLITAADENGGTATADFYDGIFKIGQTKGKKPITVLTLVEKLSCAASGKKAAIAKKKTTKRRLWGDGTGRFRTKGKHSAATVVGTKWLVQDTCTTTLTKVARGKVSVRDFAKKKTVLVRKGHKYIARAR